MVSNTRQKPVVFIRRIARFGGFLCLALALCAASPVMAKTKAKAHAAHKSHAVKAKSRSVAVLGPNPKYAAIIMDADTGMLLSQSDPDKRVYPASLTKMMTLMVVFQALQDGRITLHDRVQVSAYAHSMAPSKLDVPVGGTIKLQDAIYAVVTKSANDMAVALAEHVGGTHGTFVSMMNRKAASIGMTNTYFANACGLHDSRQVTTARDMARLARALIYNYPQYYHYFSTPAFTYDRHTYPNHNHLMETYRGMDGIKTGYIEPSGFNLVASVKRGNRRLIGVVFGGRSAKSRDAQMASLLDSAFAKLNEVVVANTVTPVPGRKPVEQAPATVAAQDDAARWADLAPMLQNKAVRGLVGEGDVDPQAVSKLEAAQDTAGQRNWAIQIGAYNSRVKTDQALQATIAGLPASMQHVTPVIAPLQTAQGWMFRGRLSGFTKTEAAQACAGIPNCLAVSPDASAR